MQILIYIISFSFVQSCSKGYPQLHLSTLTGTSWSPSVPVKCSAGSFRRPTTCMNPRIPKSAEPQKTTMKAKYSKNSSLKRSSRKYPQYKKTQIIDQIWGYPLKNHQERQIGLLSLDYCGEDFCPGLSSREQKSSKIQIRPFFKIPRFLLCLVH